MKSLYLLEREHAGHLITIVNHGGVLIVQLNDHGRRFLQDVVVRTVHNSRVFGGEEAATDDVVERSSFSFNGHATPDIRGKITWNPVRNGWKLCCLAPVLQRWKATFNPYGDECGRSLLVPENLEREEHLAAKKESYDRAIKAWNVYHLGVANARQISEPMPIAMENNCICM